MAPIRCGTSSCARSTFGQDGNYSHEAIVNRINADLANDIGNLAQRSLSMIAKNCEAEVPPPGALTAGGRGDPCGSGRAVCHRSAGTWTSRRSSTTWMRCGRWLAMPNKYFAGQAPWDMRKTDPARMNTVLYVTAEVVRQIAILAQPVVPVGAGQLLDLLSVPEDARDFSALGVRAVD